MKRFDSCRICGEELADPEEVTGEYTAAEVYRAHRRTHYPWGPTYDPDADPYLARNYEGEERETYTVTFHYTAVEHVEVEARDEWEAVERAEERRDHDGEHRETVHTEVAPGRGEQAPDHETDKSTG